MNDQISNTEGTTETAQVEKMYGAIRNIIINGSPVLQQEVETFFSDGGIKREWIDVPTVTA